ncbi:MAG: carbamoyl transferase, partial [Nanoarchaeota archaeon]|nr:carbamoyl transferase [Nanoarchaeota archaeon]
DKLQSVISIDGSCRPQMVQSKDRLYYGLLKEMKKKIGVGVVLNTSLNIHGRPLACSPNDAIDIFLQTDIKYMIMGNFLVKK